MGLAVKRAFANFGVTEDALNVVSSLCAITIDMTGTQERGWFKKPQAMIEASKIADNVCWIDTDCHVLANLQDVFTLTEPNKLAMVEDIPWSKRRQETWHNTGVVAFQGRPTILDVWARAVRDKPNTGDQEVLHSLLRDGLTRLSMSPLSQQTTIGCD